MELPDSKGNLKVGVKEVGKENPLLVLVLSPDMNFRQVLKKCLKVAEFEVEGVSNFNDCFPMLADKKPFALIHDWDSYQSSQNAFFQGRVFRMQEYEGIFRYIVTKDVTVILMAQASDYGIKKVIRTATAATLLPQDLLMAMVMDKQLDSTIKELRKLRGVSLTEGSEKFQKSIEQAYQKFGHDIQIQIEYGGFKLSEGEHAKALDVAESILKSDANNVRAMNLSARAHCKLGNIDKGLEILEAANQLSPENISRLVNMGELYFTKGAFGKAKRLFSEALQIDGKDPAALRGLAGVFIEENNSERALSILLDGISEEETAGYFNNVGVSKVRAGDFSAALRMYETALQGLHSNQLKSAVHFNIGLALKKEGRLDDAKKAFVESLNLNSENEKAKSNLALVQKLLNNTKG